MATRIVRLVREDGSSSELHLSDYSAARCSIPDELSLGEVVSVEFTDIALLIGQVSSVRLGFSDVTFLGAGRP